ncbi:PilZ domain-containing protein [Neorhizobium galegae]|uniref:NAD(P)-dependent oxidoreductase n=1 Tax=Neorhizobium galegae TaxID=399 RepID=UPI0006213F02|nr:NAD(P)-dependent oxidoreductase [Neorhizobium galegae]MCQ1781438.1 PilZ domain-containing protein [Neorhizobium galegae]MCQ1797377.1 PilZ domain-containing protein [Neorhizobium galegae]CDZ30935.1 Glycerate dehydrogenase [Neorhizobium galegae bv. officinalis]
MILALRRSVLAYRNSVQAGRWLEANQFCYFDLPINDLAGSTLGIIGDGALGRSVADLGRAFGMKVLFSDYKGTKGMGPLYTPFKKILENSDIITLHSPLMPSTRNTISTAEFAQMARRPLLINTARGGLVDEAALEHALRSGQISGAGFDVATAEPPADDHPLMGLLDLPNFILTPHVAWASPEAGRNSPRMRALKGARIVYGSGTRTRDCTVRNLSAGGAKLVMQSTADVPDVFDLVFDDGARRACVVRWRKLGDLGVEFVVCP